MAAFPAGTIGSTAENLAAAASGENYERRIAALQEAYELGRKLAGG
ncbi:MAG: hypothetical protein QHH75_07755 [Bacillota bacterium]|nr:hypothetical protein [Bacillota bacterium]